MLFGILLLIAIPALDAVDDANLALTACGFEAYRYANERNQPATAFERTLSSRCSGQIDRMRGAAIAFEVGHKRRNSAEAVAAADALIATFRAQFAGQYARRAETEAQLREVQRALREEGISNAQ